MNTGPRGYALRAPAGLTCAVLVCGGLLWLAGGSAAVSGAAPASLRLAAGSGAPADGAVWARSSAADASSPDDDDDDEPPAAGAVIVTAPLGVARNDAAWEPLLLEDVIRVATTGDSQALRGPPALRGDDDPISPDDDDDDDSDRDDAIAESIPAPDLHIYSIELVDATPASALSFVSRRPALRAPPIYTL
jgi:hypothetical protein